MHYTARVDPRSETPAGNPAPAGRREPLLRRRRLPLALSVAAAALFAAVGVAEVLLRDPVAASLRSDDAWLVALMFVTALPLALLWRLPFVALCLTVGSLLIQLVLGYQYPQTAVWAVVAASFVTVLFDVWPRAIAGGFVVAAGFVALFFTVGGVTWTDAVTTWLLLSVVWSLAIALRIYRTNAVVAERRAALFAGDREARAREAIADERARLARELHDSVGHALNVVVLHAGAARCVLPEKPDVALEALQSIETAGRQALNDIERVLGILREPGEDVGYDAQPGLREIEALCQQVREAGLPVRLSVAGERRPLPPSLELTAYRIVQEALTNTLKHAGRTEASVSLGYSARALTIEVLDGGRGLTVGDTEGGRGLLGMRERVAAFRGELVAGPRAEGGFAVRALLPLEKEDT